MSHIILDQFKKFAEHMPSSDKDETLQVLKGHLIIESLFNDYCDYHVNHKVHLKEIKLSFSNKVLLTRSLLKEPGDDWLWLSVRHLNGMRNTCAHELSPSKYPEKKALFVQTIKHSGPIPEFVFQTMGSDLEFTICLYYLLTKLSIHLFGEPISLDSGFALNMSYAQGAVKVAEGINKN